MAGIWLDVLDELAGTCTAHGRADLLRTVRQKRAQLLDPALRVLVVGEPDQGKSQLVNAIVTAQVCPVGDGRTTVLPTVVRHAETASAALVRTPPEPQATTAGSPATVERTQLPLDRIAAGVSGTLVPRSGSGPAHVEIGVPRALLGAGLVLVDTPGADGVAGSGGAAPVAALHRADTVLLVSDSTRELSVAELNMLLHLTRSHPNVVVVQTKTDLVPDWRAVADRNRRHLQEAGVPAPLIPVSAALRMRAAAGDDHQLNTESGFPLLIARLRRDLAGKSDTLARVSVTALARAVVEQLAAPLRAELDNQQATEREGPIARLHAAQREVDELRRCSTRWQNTLVDELGDLLSDVEYDMRERTRQILRAVDEAFDTADPLTGWDVFQDWLERSLTEAARENHEWLVQRCDWVARRVASNFARYGHHVLPPWSMAVPDDLADRLPQLECPPVDRFTLSQKLLTGMKGSYGGMLMFGLALTLAGMPMINPVSVGFGALLGGKSIRDEGKQMLRRRQSTVKAAVQRHVDDFFVAMTKDCRDTVRQVQRLLRDHFTALTEELQESIVESLRTAKQAAETDAAVRDRRQREIRAKMTGLARLYEQAQALTAARPGPVLLEQPA
ncbi:dynamin family protein [Micromonospora sp. KC213]|uniref:dynamin family protein n=1 Tax=Micromonospora sp. KC213 TaxID=2530378 RepID=UPI001047C3DA|nr:dynamin family protein [Micromonospora sp. KC213]TDC33792.1 GTP-binding protein [Micromonospora sp. KC213]